MIQVCNVTSTPSINLYVNCWMQMRNYQMSIKINFFCLLFLRAIKIYFKHFSLGGSLLLLIKHLQRWERMTYSWWDMRGKTRRMLEKACLVNVLVEGEQKSKGCSLKESALLLINLTFWFSSLTTSTIFIRQDLSLILINLIFRKKNKKLLTSS